MRASRYPRLAALFLLPLLLLAAHPAPRAVGSVAGLVVDGETGEALVGATVRVVGSDAGAATDLDGRFVIAGLPSGTVDLEASFVGFETALLTDVLVRDGRTTEVRIEMVSGDLGEITVEYERPLIESDAVGAALAGSARRSAPAAAAPMRSRSEAAPSEGRRDPRSTDREPPRQIVRPEPGLLTAGDVDDHLNFDAFLRWMRRAQEGQRRTSFQIADLSDRITVRIVDRDGEPVANARVRVEAEGGSRSGGLVTQAGTDGRLELFPTYDFGRGVRRLTVAVTPTGARRATLTREIDLRRVSSDRSIRLRLSQRAPARPAAMDIAFVIDVTGSMGDEIRYLTAEFESIVARLEARYPSTDLRFGLVAYRDQDDDFVERHWPFTGSARTMQRQLAGLRANGGGDYPEAMDVALEAGLDLDWRRDATRLLFLVADAPPHDDKVEQTMDLMRRARAMGVRTYPVAASGVGDLAETVMRTGAALTQGRHLFLTDDSGIGNSHQEPKVPCFVVTRLNDLLVRVIASEVEGRRVEPNRAEVIREVGDYDAGVCESRPITQRPIIRHPIHRTQDSAPLGTYLPRD